MDTIDCSAIPTHITDFAFDHITDLFDVTVDYDAQTVEIAEEDSDEARQKLTELCLEKIRDMRDEINRGYALELSENEVIQAEQTVLSDGFTIQ